MNLLELLKTGLKRLFPPKQAGDVFYINGPETLPPPLSKAQEEETFLMLETDEERARQILITCGIYCQKV